MNNTQNTNMYGSNNQMGTNNTPNQNFNPGNIISVNSNNIIQDISNANSNQIPTYNQQSMMTPQQPINEAVTNNIQSTPNKQINNSFGDPTPITNTDTNNDEIVATKDYLIHLILCCIPIVNIIILLIRIFSKKTNKNLKNLSKAQLILTLISTIICIILLIIFKETLNLFIQNILK